MITKKTARKKALELIAKLGNPKNNPVCEDVGLCVNIIDETGYRIEDLFPKYFKIVEEWKYFSGDLNYPIMGEDVYDANIPKWDNDTKQGKLRRAFCRYLAKRLGPKKKKSSAA